MKAAIGGVTWTWRVQTVAGPVLIPDARMNEAARKAGVYWPEHVQPATAEEHAAVTGSNEAIVPLHTVTV